MSYALRALILIELERHAGTGLGADGLARHLDVPNARLQDELVMLEHYGLVVLARDAATGRVMAAAAALRAQGLVN